MRSILRNCEATLPDTSFSTLVIKLDMRFNLFNILIQYRQWVDVFIQEIYIIVFTEFSFFDLFIFFEIREHF